MGELAPWSREEYDADQSRVRSTNLKKILSGQGPAKYHMDVMCRGNRAKDDDDDQSRAMVLGGLLHEWVLEDKRLWFVTSTRRNTKAWRDECDEYEGMTPIKPAEFEKLERWYQAIQRNQYVKALLATGGMKEQTILWEETVGDIVIPCKARLDFMTPTRIIVDIKTTRTSNRDEFEKQAYNLLYDFSAAFYVRGLLTTEFGNPGERVEDAKFTHIAVLDDGDVAWAYCWPMSSRWLQIGNAKVGRALTDLAECLKNERDGMPQDVAWPDRMARSQLRQTVPTPWMLEETQMLASRGLEIEG